MRDHFDPLVVVYQNQHRELEQSPYHSGDHTHTQVQVQMQDQGHRRRRFHQDDCNDGRVSPNDPFDDALGVLQGVAWNQHQHQHQHQNQHPIPAVHRLRLEGDSVGTKRSSNEFLDCNVIQSSLKRVRLSRCPGEFRLQRDVNTLESKHWIISDAAAEKSVNFSSTTWIHRSTGACLTMMDSLRICLFLPMTASGGSNSNSNSNWNSNHNGGLPLQQPNHHRQHQKHCYHRDYRWRIMIQIPRMYPHQPPAVTRIEGLSLDSIAINEQPPDARNNARNNRGFRGDPSSSLYFTETQMARHSSFGTMNTTTESANTNNNTSSTMSVAGTATKIEWNQWSPVSGLGELLEFLLGVATSYPSASPSSTTTTTTTMASKKSPFAMSVAARASTSSSSSLSSVSSSSSSSSAAPSSSSIWGKTSAHHTGTNHNSNSNSSSSSSNNNNDHNHNHNHNPTASLFFGGQGGNTNNSGNQHQHQQAFATTAVMAMETGTTSSHGTNISGASFLLPNRFDVGYGRCSSNGYERYNQNPHSFAGTARNVTANFHDANDAAAQGQHRQNPLQYREKTQGEDEDFCMDMS